MGELVVGEARSKGVRAGGDAEMRIRSLVLGMIYAAGSGHPGGALSCSDLLVYISRELLGWDRATRRRNDDRFVLSKGHSSPALYAAAAETGLIPLEELTTFRKLGGSLQGHPHVLSTPWVETSTGSLGQGFSVAIGMALGMRHQSLGGTVYVMLGDGELQEGEVWEGAMCAGHYRLSNLCAIIDYNKMQSDDVNEAIMGLEPLCAKWEAFNWRVRELDGHDFGEIAAAFAWAEERNDGPAVLVAHTVKGKGVSFMEGSPDWHGSVKLRDDEYLQALRDLGVAEEDLHEWLPT